MCTVLLPHQTQPTCDDVTSHVSALNLRWGAWQTCANCSDISEAREWNEELEITATHRTEPAFVVARAGRACRMRDVLLELDVDTAVASPLVTVAG